MGEEKVSPLWKYSTIVLGLLLLMETAGVVWIFQLGAESIANETVCSQNICTNRNAATYYYDSPSHVCQCYDSQHEVIYSEIIR